jgi:hypothetical protein
MFYDRRAENEQEQPIEEPVAPAEPGNEAV